MCALHGTIKINGKFYCQLRLRDFYLVCGLIDVWQILENSPQRAHQMCLAGEIPKVHEGLARWENHWSLNAA